VVGGVPGDEDRAAGAGLRHPRVGHLLYRGGGDDPIIGRAGRVALGPICGNHGDWVASGSEGTAGVVGENGVDLDTGHIVGAEAVASRAAL
jgi:hypothetical protein